MTLRVDGERVPAAVSGGLVYAEHFAPAVDVHTAVQKTLATAQPFKSFITRPTKG